MEFGPLLDNAQLVLLMFARVFALMSVVPLLSSSAIPAVARVALSFFTVFCIYPHVDPAALGTTENAAEFVLLLAGEAMLGVIIGFFINIIFSVFLVSGQFYSFQMGFGASVVYDPMAQEEVPLLGQFMNLLALLTFITGGGVATLFVKGIYQTFGSLTAMSIVSRSEPLARMMLGGLVTLFGQSLILSLPILGTLFIVSVTMGLLAKAAPQMNLLMLGFPIQIATGFVLLFLCVPFLMERFMAIINAGYGEISRMFTAPGVLP